MSILYKYRPFDANALLLLINRSLYFANPDDLNDPLDCQIGINAALESATDSPDLRRKIYSFIQSANTVDDARELIQEFEVQRKQFAVLAFTKENRSPLMWSHYADRHKGFCIGFNFSNAFAKRNSTGILLGPAGCTYEKINPFRTYFARFSALDNETCDETFWMDLMCISFLWKSQAWRHEKEVRVIRRYSGGIHFEPTELREIIFGLKMIEENKIAIRSILSGIEWKHVTYRRIDIHTDGFKLRVVYDQT
jgi:hypothetical protein